MCSVVVTVTKLRAGKPRDRGSVPDRRKIFSSSPTRRRRFWRPPHLPLGRYRRVARKGPGHETGRYLVPRLKNSWSCTSVSLICIRGLYRDNRFFIKLRCLLVRLEKVTLYNCKRYILKYNTLFLLATKVFITVPSPQTGVLFRMSVAYSF
jgi:hypothetical protein